MISLKEIWNSIVESFKAFEPEEYKNKSKVTTKKNKRPRKRLTKKEVITIENEITQIRLEGGKPNYKHFMNKYDISDTTFYKVVNGKHKHSTLKVL
jgi:hypothetical protein